MLTVRKGKRQDGGWGRGRREGDGGEGNNCVPSVRHCSEMVKVGKKNIVIVTRVSHQENKSLFSISVLNYFYSTFTLYCV